jgi:toxin ParE1/3/4
MSAATFAPQAGRDLLSASDRIAEENVEAAQALRDAVDRAAQRIGDHPHIGVVRSELAPEPYRFLFLTRFLYVMVYNASWVPPIVVRVLHGARDLPELLKDL